MEMVVEALDPKVNGDKDLARLWAYFDWLVNNSMTWQTNTSVLIGFGQSLTNKE